jgi:aryl-alcohol dehydrogenase-like predicted oxidoreductase
MENLQMISLDHYRLLGRSGLRVSPLALGTMTFGKDWGWGADASESRRMFDYYIDRGGNFVDTSVNYTEGASERLCKYSRTDLSNENEANVSPTRKGVIASTGHLNERSLNIADVVGVVAKELNVSRSQVALAWTLVNPAVVAPIMGARTLEQAKDNFGALDVSFTPDQLDRLNSASAPAPIFPERFVARPMVQQLIFGGSTVETRR